MATKHYENRAAALAEITAWGWTEHGPAAAPYYISRDGSCSGSILPAFGSVVVFNWSEIRDPRAARIASA